MDDEAARAVAERAHAGAVDRYGQPLLPHVRRVALAAPPEARTVAWLHEVLEYADVSEAELRAAGVGGDELTALGLLARDLDGDEASYLAHIARIASAPGDSGRLARMVKRIDLVDRAAHRVVDARAPTPPPYLVALSILTRGELRAGPGRVPAHSA
jgi:hypothetical protein